MTRIDIFSAFRNRAVTKTGSLGLNYFRTSLLLSAALILPKAAYGQCLPAAPAAIDMASGSCTDNGIARQNTNDAAIRVTGGAYTGVGVTIISNGNTNSIGAIAVGPGMIDLTDGSVTTHGGDGLVAVNGGQITARGLIVEAQADVSSGVSSDGAGSLITISNSTIQKFGEVGGALFADNGGMIIGSNLELSSIGGQIGQGHVVLAVRAGTLIEIHDSIIDSAAVLIGGIYANKGSTIIGSGLQVHMTGQNSDAVVAAEGPGVVTISDSVLLTEGNGGIGINAWSGSQVEATDVEIETRGNRAFGIFSSEAGTHVRVSGGSVLTVGANSHGVVVQNGGQVTADNTAISVSGAGAAAVQIGGGSSATPSTLTVTGGSLSSELGPLILSEGGTGSISLNGPIITTSGVVGGLPALATVTVSEKAAPSNLTLDLNGLGSVAGIFRVTGAGNVSNTTFDATDWAGDLDVASGNTANTLLHGSSWWTGRATNATNIQLDGSSAWRVTGDSNITSTLTNAGQVQFVPLASGFSTLVARDFVGQNGSIAFNTFLGSDGSPTNLLMIDGGTASGVTRLSILDAGGGGALTSGDGIRLVQAINGGTTTTDAFTLANRVVTGAYEYNLFRGGSASGEDWFLRSSMDIHPGGPAVPLYRPETALYAPIPAMARHMGLATLGTLHERVGEEMNIRGLSGTGEIANGVWARVIGERSDRSWAGAVEARIRDAHLAGIQAGLDVYRAEHDNGHRDHVGLYGAYSDYRSSSVSGFALGQRDLMVGSLTLSGPAAGAYWTHFGPSGWYLDAVAQGNWFDASGTSLDDTQMSTRGTGFAASLEGGYPIQLSDRWQIEPQAQVVYQTVSVNSSEDAYSTVSWHAGEAVTARLGARLQYTVEDGATLWQPYAKANLWHSSGGFDQVFLGNSPATDSHFGNISAELGVGFTAKFNQSSSLYGHVDHRWSVGGKEKRSATKGALGLRFNW